MTPCVQGGTTVVIIGNQLYRHHPLVEAGNRVLMIESAHRLYKPGLHIQKTVLITAAMRHYAADLRAQGIVVDYQQAPAFAAGIAAHRAVYAPQTWALLEPSDFDTAGQLSKWVEGTEQFVLYPDTVGFTCDTATFRGWAAGQKSLVLERFYRWQRTRLGILMDGAKPVEGRWNFDAENRESPRKMPSAPTLPALERDEVTQAALVEAQINNPAAFGTADLFHYPVTHDQAAIWLDVFIQERLAQFGRWEDAMRAGDPFLFHGVIALLLNIGLLTPADVAQRVEAAYRAGQIPVQSAEGFIRQVIGWREYVHGVYWVKMPDYRNHNYFEHSAPLPEFFWTGTTAMQCLHATVDDLKEHAYTHHIPRLMLLANFANLAGLSPAALVDWFKDVYIDAYDWVMWPNVLGLGLYADGGLMSTKPYIASAAYIKKMSQGYCNGCRFNSELRTGPDACPFNTLYWDFLDRHRARLAGNPRMAIPLQGLKKRSDIELIRERAAEVKGMLGRNEL